MKTCQSNLHPSQPLLQLISLFVWQQQLSSVISATRDTESERGIFLWCTCLKWGRPHTVDAFEVVLCSRVHVNIIFHSAHFKSCAYDLRCAPQAIPFPPLHWNRLITDPVWMFSPLYASSAGGMHVQNTYTFAQCWLQNHIFIQVVLLFPERTECWVNKCVSMHTAVWRCPLINIHFHAKIKRD